MSKGGGLEGTGRFNSSPGFEIFTILFLSNGSKEVRNLIQMTLKWLFFAGKSQ